ncbi:MAG: hypothetical protein M3Q59_03370 [Actinomycetota bacterium]|nr:hypothetical protein [Actinomycetota bacterium]
MKFDRLPRASAAAAALLALDAVIRLLAGGPYPGATFLLLAACGISLLPLLPAELGSPSLRLAVLPALGLGSFAILLTTVSIVGIPLTELSIRLAVLALVFALAAATCALGRGEKTTWSAKREGVAVAVLVGVFAFSLGSSWDIAGSFPPRGTDWGHYLLYAEEVETQDALLIDDPLAGEEDRVFADPVGVGAVYGSFLILDGTSSRPLGWGVVIASALTPLSVYAAVGALWGIGADCSLLRPMPFRRSGSSRCTGTGWRRRSRSSSSRLSCSPSVSCIAAPGIDGRSASSASRSRGSPCRIRRARSSQLC